MPKPGDTEGKGTVPAPRSLQSVAELDIWLDHLSAMLCVYLSLSCWKLPEGRMLALQALHCQWCLAPSMAPSGARHIFAKCY